MHAGVLSRVRLFVIPWTVVHQDPLSMEFSRQEYWSGWPLPSPGDLHNPGIEPVSPVSPALAGRFFTTEPPGKPLTLLKGIQNNTVTLENSLVVSYKTKHTLNHLNQQLHCLVFIQRKCTGYPHKNLHIAVLHIIAQTWK